MSSCLSLYVRPFDETENYEYNSHGKLGKDNGGYGTYDCFGRCKWCKICNGRNQL